MKNNKTISLIFGMLLMTILLMSSIFAFAVSSMYWEGNPLTIKPGETQESFIVLQNMAGSEPVNAQVTILEGAEIVSLNDPGKVYEIPVGQVVNVYYTVKIPSTSITGQASQPITGGTYNIIFDVTTISDVNAGGFGFGAGMQKVVPVLINLPVIEKNALAPWMYYLIVGMLALIIAVIGIIIIRKKKRNKINF